MAYDQMLQYQVEGVKNIARTDVCLFDADGRIMASTVDNAADFTDSVCVFARSQADMQTVAGYQYFKILDHGITEAVMLIKGDRDETYTIGKLVAFQLQNLMNAYKEKFDKENFIKNLILENLLPVDVYNKAQKLHIKTDIRRIVFVVSTNKIRDNGSISALRSLFNVNRGDFVTAVDEKNIIIVKEAEPEDDYENMTDIAESIVAMLQSEVMVDAKVAIGTFVNEIRGLSKSYNEALMAQDVGNVFYEGKCVVAYNSLGIGRLIYQLPLSLCEMYIKEVFPEITPDDFDEETILTINKFFENNLNISETARQLFIHRNTLVYRIEKVSKSTGLDLRVFDDAITFKIALMVIKYRKYKTRNDEFKA